MFIGADEQFSVSSLIFDSTLRTRIRPRIPDGATVREECA